MAASPPLTSPCSWAELFSECHNVWYRVVYHLSDRKKSCCAAHMARWQTWQMKHFVCFCLSTGFFPNTSLLSEQKGPAIFDVVCERERVREGAERGGGGEVSSSDIQLQSSVTQRSVCWEIIWHLVLDTSRRWVEKERGGGGKKKKGGVGDGGRRDRRQREWWDKEVREGREREGREST